MINKDTIVSEIGPFDTKIKLGFLVKILSEVTDLRCSLDEIIQEIREENTDMLENWCGDDYFFLRFNPEGIELGCIHNEGYEYLIKILEKVFKEEFYYMRSDSFAWDAEVEDPDLKTFSNKAFVSTNIESNDKTILEVITKDHGYYNVGEIDKNNFLTNDEIILFDSLCENDKAEQCFSGRYQYYYIRKKDFNIEKWWLGWTDE